MADPGLLVEGDAFGGVLTSGRFGSLQGTPGVTLSRASWGRCEHLLGASEAAAERLPGRGGSLRLEGVTVFAIGPGRWMAFGEDAVLQQWRTGVQADFVDLSDAYAVLRVAGHNARDVLARVVPLDLHPREWRVGAAAVTRAGGMDLVVLQIGDPVFDVAVPRSYAGSLARWVLAAALPFGVTVAP